MSMFTAFNVSASGMTAQQLRTDVISENIANADTTRTSDGTPYVRKAVVFTEKTMTGTALGKSAYGSYGTGAYSTFSDALRLANGGEYGATVVGLEMMSSVCNENAEDERKKKIVKSAISTLSASELQAIKAVFDALDGTEGILVASRIADNTGITRSVIVNALKKFDSAGVISTKSSGMKGTKIKVLNEAVFDAIKRLDD